MLLRAVAQVAPQEASAKLARNADIDYYATEFVRGASSPPSNSAPPPSPLPRCRSPSCKGAGRVKARRVAERDQRISLSSAPLPSTLATAMRPAPPAPMCWRGKTPYKLRT